MKKPVPALIPFLVFVSMVFIGILVYAYIETKKANPQMIETTRGGASAPLVLTASLPGTMPARKPALRGGIPRMTA